MTTVNGEPTMSRHFFRARVAAVACAITFLPALLTAQDEDSLNLFARPERNKADLSPKQSRMLAKLREQTSTVKAEPVMINEDAFRADRLRLNLDSKSLLAKRLTMEELPGGYTWTGSVTDNEKEPPTAAQFLVKGQHKTGSFAAGKYIYELRSLGQGLHVLITRDPSKAPKDHPPEFKKIERDSGQKPAPPDNTRLDTIPGKKPNAIPVTLLIAYTQGVSDLHDDMKADMDSLLALYVNKTFRVPGIPLTIDVVHLHPVDYQESGNLVTELADLQGTRDGQMDEVHALRTKYNADIVTLLVETGNYAGYSAAIRADHDSAFSVVMEEWAGINYSLAHEIGHLFGGRHNRQDDAAVIPYPHGHGYHFSRGKWRTIMACECGDADCRRLGIWSSPYVEVNGVKAGTAALEYNARVMTDEAPRMSQIK